LVIECKEDEMGVLDEAIGYLSGPMEFVKDHGVEWRRKFIRLVHEADLNIDLIDPTNKPGDSIGENPNHQVELQKAGRFKELQDYVSDYRHLDLRYTDISDFLIVVVDPTVPQWGTSNETYVAEMQKKPTFFIVENGLYNLPRWLFDVIDRIQSWEPSDAQKEANVFESVEEVVDELVALDRGDKPLSREWVLVRKVLRQQRCL
jgi:hypothetical protein